MVKLLVPFLLLLGIVGATLVTDRPLPRADFTFINRGDVTTLDLQRMSWMQDLRVARLIYEGLVQNDVFTWDYAVRPAVAESWEISPDGRTYTFHLRADAKWSNGAPVTADDFVFSWRRALLPDTVADYSGMFLLIKGAQEFYDWRQKCLDDFAARGGSADDARALYDQIPRRFEELVGLTAVDSRTLRIELAAPTPYFLDLCAFAVFAPVYPPLVRQYERVDPASARIRTEQGWTKPPHFIGNGPYKLTLWQFKRDMRFEINEHYWNRDALNIRTISTPSIEDKNAQVLAFRTGAVDWVSDVTVDYRAEILAQKQDYYRDHADEYARLKAQGLDQFQIDRMLPPDPRQNIHAVPSFGTYWYNFNCNPRLEDGRDNPFHDPRVRRAFAMAVDKTTIVDQVRRCAEPPAATIIPPGSIAGYNSPRGVSFDPAAARALLAEAGYPDPSKFITVEILYNKDGGHELIAQAVMKNWSEHLGVPVTLAQKEIKVFRDDLKRQNYMVSRAGWYGDYGDPTTFLDLSRSTDGNNDRKYNDPAYDAMLDAAAAEPDPARRYRILEEAERKLVDEDLPLIPLYHYVTFYMMDAHKVSGLNCHPRVTQNIDLIDMLGDGFGRDAPLMLPLRPPAGVRNGAN